MDGAPTRHCSIRRMVSRGVQSASMRVKPEGSTSEGPTGTERSGLPRDRGSLQPLMETPLFAMTTVAC
jgi:hypothetical protein